MAFVFDEIKHVARDDEQDVEISKKYGLRDGIYTYTCQFKQGDLQFNFEVIFDDVAITQKGNERQLAGREDEIIGRVTNAVYVLEHDFRSGLRGGLSQLGKSNITETDYMRFKQYTLSGLVALITKNGTTLSSVSGLRFEAAFEDNLESFAAKHPGKIRGYNSNRLQKH